MSGGCLVVLDRRGRDVKSFELRAGSASVGSDPSCDVRVLSPAALGVHVTLGVRPAGVVLRAHGATLINGARVSVAALRHGDTLTLAGRRLRWDYHRPGRPRRAASPVAPFAAPEPGRSADRRRRSEPARRPAPQALHRDSAPASSGRKQVAVVQPQRRDVSEPHETDGTPAASRKASRARCPAPPPEAAPRVESREPRSPAPAAETPRPAPRPAPRSAPRSAPARPLRLAVLRRAHSAHRAVTVTKIREPREIDHTKRAALLLMAARPGPLAATPRRAASAASAPSSASIPERRARSGRRGPRSPSLASPKKSAMRDPKAGGDARRTESIKFDLTDLDGRAASDVVSPDDTDDPEDQPALRYSDTSSATSPSPQKRSARSAGKTRGSPPSPRPRTSSRSTVGGRKAFDESDSRYSRKTSKSLSDESYATTFTSRLADAAGPGSKRRSETCSVADSLTADSDESLYNSADSDGSASSGAPRTLAGRQTGSRNPSLLGSGAPRSKRTLSPNAESGAAAESAVSQTSTTKRSASPCARVSRAARSGGRVGDGDVLLVEDEDSSPEYTRRPDGSPSSPIVKNISIAASPSDGRASGTVTPKDGHGPREPGTPILNIQSLLDRSSINRTFVKSQKSKNTRSDATREIVGAVLLAGPQRSRAGVESGSSNSSPRRSSRAGKIARNGTAKESSRDSEEAVTPKSAVKLVQEGVKNKHSTAKKPQSKRSLIDDLNDSDLVKELFNSPVKRKLSRSMIEFSRKRSDDDVAPARPPGDVAAGEGGAAVGAPALSGVEKIFDLLSRSVSVRVERISALSPDDDLRGATEASALLRSPDGEIAHLSGIKILFSKCPRKVPSDASGPSGTDASRAEAPARDGAEESFDRWVGAAPRVRRYGAARSWGGARGAAGGAGRARAARSLHEAIGAVTGDVSGRLEGEQRERSARPRRVEGRPVPHSTPVKGREHAPDASELGRVSPIAPDGASSVTSIRVLRSRPASTVASTSQCFGAESPGANDRASAAEVAVSAEPSPRGVRRRIVDTVTTDAEAAERKKADENRTTGRRRRPPSGAADERPAPSPRRSRKVARAKEMLNAEVVQSAPKTVRSTRQKNRAAVSPKKTRSRAAKARVVVGAPSPAAGRKSIRNADVNIEIEKPERTRSAILKREVSKRTGLEEVTERNASATKSKKVNKGEAKAPASTDPTDRRRGRRKAAPDEAGAGGETVEVAENRRGRGARAVAVVNIKETKNSRTLKRSDPGNDVTVPKKPTAARRGAGSTAERKDETSANNKGKKKVVIVTPSSGRGTRRSSRRVEGDARVARSRRGARGVGDDAEEKNGGSLEKETKAAKRRAAKEAGDEENTKRRRTRSALEGGDRDGGTAKGPARAPEPRRSARRAARQSPLAAERPRRR